MQQGDQGQKGDGVPGGQDQRDLLIVPPNNIYKHNVMAAARHIAAETKDTALAFRFRQTIRILPSCGYVNASTLCAFTHIKIAAHTRYGNSKQHKLQLFFKIAGTISFFQAIARNPPTMRLPTGTRQTLLVHRLQHHMLFYRVQHQHVVLVPSSPQHVFLPIAHTLLVPPPSPQPPRPTHLRVLDEHVFVRLQR